jgi:hypothetical protein
MSTMPIYLGWHSQALGDLRDLYQSLQTKASLGSISALLTGRSRSLLDLDIAVSVKKMRSQHHAGTRTVPISLIKGSEGRSRDFDCDFNPLHSRTRDRWISVALARSQGDSLSLVELIQLGDDYFVRDGHHRISVARAFGEEYIDAKVIVLELEPVSAPAITPAHAWRKIVDNLYHIWSRQHPANIVGPSAPFSRWM